MSCGAQAETLSDKRIVVAIDSWEADSAYPAGHYVRTLGLIGDRETETEVRLGASSAMPCGCQRLPVRVMPGLLHPMHAHARPRFELRRWCAWGASTRMAESCGNVKSYRFKCCAVMGMVAGGLFAARKADV